MWLFLGLACGGDAPPDPEPPAPVLPTSETGVGLPTGSTGTTTDTAPPLVVPLLDEALSARCPDPGAAATGPPPGDDLLKVTMSSPGAVCNDGTPAVMFVRTATDPAHAADWVFNLGPGGLCVDYEECAERWCAEGAYDAGKMSSRWLPDGIAGAGLSATGPRNHFAGWNQVTLPYCSSDMWLGRAADRVLDDGSTPYRLHFRGNDIVDAAVDALRAGVVSDDGSQVLASVADANTLIFAGSSAGAAGQGVLIENVAAQLPTVRVLGLTDSGVEPTEAAFPTPELGAAYEAEKASRWPDLVALYAATGDDACMASVGDPAVCADRAVLWATPRPTPNLIHFDLFDTVGSSIQNLSPLPRALYAQTIEVVLEDAAAQGMAVHATACGGHMAANDDVEFHSMTVADTSGVPWSTHDALVALVEGQIIVAQDDPSGAGSVCP